MKEYKGHKIYLNEKKGLFYVQTLDGERSQDMPTMAEAMEFINKITKQKFKKFAAWASIGDRWSNEKSSFKFVTVTCLDFRGDWRITTTGKGSERHYGEIFKDTPNNKILAEEVNKKREQIASLQKEIEALEKKLVPVDRDEVRAGEEKK
ncbi:MAG: hypothetical protein WC750_06140 [Patescibacteria group bacterium]